MLRCNVYSHLNVDSCIQISCLHTYRGLFGHKRNIQYTADVANLAFVFIILRVIQVYYAKLDSMAFSLHPVNCSSVKL